MSLPEPQSHLHAPELFSEPDVRARAALRLSLDMTALERTPTSLERWGDHVLNPGAFPAAERTQGAPAAVLAAVVSRPEGATMLLTRRATHLRQHSGQIAFPGGRIDATDASPVAAAMREAQEEVGLDARHIEPLGYLDTYVTGTGFRIFPVLAIVTPPFTLTINHDEVDDAFEVPLSFLMDAANHRLDSREIAGAMRQFYAMPYNDRYIWGATAGMLRNLYVRLYQ